MEWKLSTLLLIESSVLQADAMRGVLSEPQEPLTVASRNRNAIAGTSPRRQEREPPVFAPCSRAVADQDVSQRVLQAFI